MSDKDLKYIEGIGWRHETLHNMHRRMQGHDYHDRSIYMLTMTVEGRRPLLGILCAKKGFADEAYIEPSELGKEVERCWLTIPEHYPDIKPLALQLMPDHIHGLLFVQREQAAHLGQVIKGFKIGCSRAYWQLCSAEVGAAGLSAAGLSAASYNSQNRTTQNVSPKRPPLFEPGYQDSILKGKGQLETMFNYIATNPCRLAIKHEVHDLFRIVRELTLNGQTFAAIGNRWLLDRPDRMQVRCHNNTTAENLRLIQKQKEYFLDRGRKGGVVVSPCISAGEKEIARTALDAGVPLVVILENGFPPMYKPPGKYFEACAKGLLLMLAPWPYHTDRRTITRQQCLALNDIAYQISTEPWTPELEDMLTRK